MFKVRWGQGGGGVTGRERNLETGAAQGGAEVGGAEPGVGPEERAVGVWACPEGSRARPRTLVLLPPDSVHGVHQVLQITPAPSGYKPPPSWYRPHTHLLLPLLSQALASNPLAACTCEVRTPRA